MANTIAEATGIDRSRQKHTHRLGSVASRVCASTWRTFIRAGVSKDGAGYVVVERDHELIHRFEFGPE